MQEQTVASGDASLFVRTVGGANGGPTLIVLHGGPGISHEYLLGLAALADDHLRIVFYDQRQTGRSTGTAASSDPLHEWAFDLDAVRRAVGAERVHLLGHSSGGYPAIAYGSLFPAHTESIIFVDAAAPTAIVQRQAVERMRIRAAALKAAGILPEYPPSTPEDGTGFLTVGVPIIHCAKPQPASALSGATFRPIVSERLMQALGDYDLREVVGRLTMPTLSYLSPIPCGIEMAGSLYDALPHDKAQRFTLPDCGHLPWIECPEPFFAVLKAFLDSLLQK